MRRLLPLLTFLAVALATAAAAPSAHALNGDLTFASCQANAAITSQTCTVQAGLLDGVVDVQVSPDGRNAYALGTASDALVVFDRNATTGALTIKSGAAGCFANAALGACTVLAGALDEPQSLAISPDGGSVYVASSTSAALVGFARDATTGALTPISGAAGCASNAALGSCTVVTNQLLNVGAVSVSPDSRHVYAVSQISNVDTSGIVNVFQRDTTTGALTYDTCVASGSVGACTVQAGIFDVGNATTAKLVLSPNGAHAYLNARGSSSLAIFDRNATTGALTLKAGAAGCIANAALGACTVLTGYLPSPVGLSISPNGANVYANAGGTAETIDTVIVFARSADTGQLAKLTGATGCLASATLNDCTVVNPAAQPAANFDSRTVALSPDGRSAYITSSNWNMLLAFNRSTTTGALTLKSGATGCFASAAMTPCTTVTNLLVGANPVTVSPEGRSVYTGAGTTTNPNVAVFARARPPLLAQVAPITGTTVGGTSVVITGTNFEGATRVLFGSTAGVITANTATSITVTTPARSAGKVGVSVTTPDGTSTLASAFTFVAPVIRSTIAVAKTTVSYSRTTVAFRTVITVNAAGTINQVVSRVVRGRRVAICSRKKTVARAGTYPIVCIAGSATRSTLRRGRVRVRVLSSFTATRSTGVSNVQNLNLLRRR